MQINGKNPWAQMRSCCIAKLNWMPSLYWADTEPRWQYKDCFQSDSKHHPSNISVAGDVLFTPLRLRRKRLSFSVQFTKCLRVISAPSKNKDCSQLNVVTQRWEEDKLSAEPVEMFTKDHVKPLQAEGRWWKVNAPPILNFDFPSWQNLVNTLSVCQDNR